MKKGSRLEEYREGYGLIRDGELNGLFNDYLDTLIADILDKGTPVYSHYWIFYTSNNKNALGRVAYYLKELHSLKTKGSEFSDQASQIAKDYVPQMAKKYIASCPNSIPVMSIFCFSANFTDVATKEANNGLLISGQTKDGRCCMAQYKLMMDGINVCGHELIDEYIPKKHTNDEDYEWEGNTAFFEEVDRLTNK